MFYHFYQVSVVGFFLILITDWLRRGLWTKSLRWKRDWRQWNSGKNTQERNAKWVRFYQRESLIIGCWLVTGLFDADSMFISVLGWAEECQDQRVWLIWMTWQETSTTYEWQTVRNKPQKFIVEYWSVLFLMNF